MKRKYSILLREHLDAYKIENGLNIANKNLLPFMRNMDCHLAANINDCITNALVAWIDLQVGLNDAQYTWLSGYSQVAVK